MAGKSRASENVGMGRSSSGPAIRRRWRRTIVSRLGRIRGRFSPGLNRRFSYSDFPPFEYLIKGPNLAQSAWDVERNARLEAAVGDVSGKSEQLEQAEARYQIISELISDFAYVARVEPPGRFTIEWVSEQASRILGYPVDQIATSEQWISIIHPEDRQVAINSLARSAQGESVADEIRYIRPDGSVLWLNISARPVINPVSGQVEKIFGAGLDITNRKLAEEALSQSQARYHTLFDESPVPLWEIDLSGVKALVDRLASDGATDVSAYFKSHLDRARDIVDLVKIIDVNRAAQKLYSENFRSELGDFIGAMIRDDAQLIVNGLTALAEGRSFIKLEGMDLGAARGARYTEMYLSVVHGYEHNYGRVIVSVLDLTGRYRAEQALRQEARRLELINTITSAALTQNDLKSTLEVLVSVMKNFSGADDCFITRWDDERLIPVMLAATGDVEQRLQGQFIAPGEPNITRAVLEAGHVLLAQPGDAASLNQRVAPAFHHAGALAMPLQVGGEKYGAAVLVYKDVPSFDDEELDLWEKVAAQVSLVIASLDHFERARRRAEELEKIEQVSSELRKAQAYTEILDITVREMVQMVGADRGAVIIKRRGKWALEIEKSRDDQPAFDAYPLDEAIALMILRRSQRLLYADPATGIIMENCPWLGRLDAVTVIPIKSAETTIGMAVIGWYQRRVLGPGDLQLLNAVAEMAGNALQRAIIVETLEQRVADRTRNLQILYDLSALSNRQQELRKLTRSALKQLIKVLGGEAGAFFQLSPDQQAMEMAFSFGLPAEVMAEGDHIAFTLERRQALEAHQQPFLVPEIRSLPLDTQGLVRRGYEAVILIPIREIGQLSGVMAIFGGAKKLSLEEKSLAAAVADLLATAAENAQLQKRSKDAAVIEERQRLARALHDSVTQSLYSLTLFTEAGREHTATGNQERALHFMERSSETAHRALREMRMLLYELRPPELARLGLVEALRYRLEAVERRLGMEASLSVKHILPIPTDVEDAMFWIAQEALNNALRHAGASKVSLTLDFQPQRILVAIVDNGCGFGVEDVPVGGMGLVGMRERARKIGARLDVVSSPGRGTRVEVKLRPFDPWKRKNDHE